MSDTTKKQKQLQWDVTFKRTSNLPLDRSSIFNDYQEAMKYVNGLDDNKKGVPYLGQVFTILNNTSSSYDESGVYVIKELPNENNGYQGKIERAGEIVGGDAISVADGNQVDVKLDNTTDKNFITKNEEGLAVTGIDANKTTTTKNIQILGGPLAKLFENAGIAVSDITAGTSVEEIFMNLLCQEEWPSPTPDNGTCSFKINGTPSISVSGGTYVNNGLIEIGTPITIDQITAKQVTTNTVRKPSIKNIEWGYRTELTGATNTNTSIETNWTTAQTDSSFFKLEVNIDSGFTGNSEPDAVTATTYSSCKIEPFALTAVSGTNKITVTETPAQFEASHTGIPAYYVVSNMGNVDENKKTQVISAVIEHKPSISAVTNSLTLTGVYPIFTNGISASTSDDKGAAMVDLENHVSGDGTKLTLMKSGTQFAVSFAAHTKGVEGYRLYLPGDWKVTEAFAINANTAKYAVNQTTKFIALADKVERTIQGNKVEYTVYEYLATEGANRVRFKVG